MKILVATPLYPPEIGGPATHVRVIEEELPKRGFTLDILKLSDFKTYSKLIRYFAFFRALIKHARHANFIYVLDAISVGLPAYAASMVTGRSYILRVAGDHAWEQGVQRYGVNETLDEFYVTRTSYPFVVQLWRFIQSKVAKRATYVIVPSYYFQSIVEKWGVPRERIKVIYNSFEINSDTGSTDVYPFITDKVILSAGRLIPWKGFEAVIEAVDQLKSTYPDIRLAIAGDGPLKNHLERVIAERKLQSCVFLLGSIPQGTLQALLSRASMFVLNTAYEGFSHQLLEVMHAGVPIITTNAGGNRELLEHEKNGLVVAYNDVKGLHDSMVRLFEDQALRSALISGAHDTVGQFTRTRMMSELERLFTL